MEIPKDDTFMEIMSLLHKRNRLCREWMEMLDRDLEAGVITYEEYKEQMRMIGEEIAVTGEAIRRQEEYLKNVMINKD